MATSGGTPTSAPTDSRTGANAAPTFVRILAVLGLVAPMVAAPPLGFRGDSHLLLAAVGPSAMAVLADRDRSAVFPLVAAGAAGLALVASGHVATSVLFLTVLAFLAGLGASRGWHGALCNLAAWTSALAIDPVAVTWDGTSHPAGQARPIVVAVLIVLTVSAWTVLCARVATRGRAPTPAGEISPATARLYALVLAALVAVTAILAGTVFAGPNSWWAPMTTLLVVLPDLSATRVKVVGRFVGTAAGALIAGAVVAALGTDHAAIGALATLALLAALWANFAAPYAVYALLLTAAVVLPSSTDTGAFVAADVNRLAFTALAALLAFTTCLLLPRLARTVAAHTNAEG